MPAVLRRRHRHPGRRRARHAARRRGGVRGLGDLQERGPGAPGPRHRRGHHALRRRRRSWPRSAAAWARRCRASRWRASSSAWPTAAGRPDVAPRRRGASRWTSASSRSRATSRAPRRAEPSSASRARPVRRPDDLVGLDGIVVPGGESTTMSMLLESSGLADPLAKELAAGLPGLRDLRGDDPARAPVPSTVVPTSATSAPSTSPCGATGSAASSSPSSATSRCAALRGRPAARRVHPGPAGRVDGPGRGGAGRGAAPCDATASATATAPFGGDARSRCCAARARSWWPPSTPSSRRTDGCTSCSCR